MERGDWLLGFTCVDEPTRRSFTELFGLVGQRDLDDPGDVTGRGLDPDGMRGDQLERQTGGQVSGGRGLYREKHTGRLYRLLISCVTSLHTSMVPKTTCRPSKKLSPIRMTVAPPVVQPSLGLMALIQGVAAGRETPRDTERHRERDGEGGRERNFFVIQT